MKRSNCIASTSSTPGTVSGVIGGVSAVSGVIGGVSAVSGVIGGVSVINQSAPVAKKN